MCSTYLTQLHFCVDKIIDTKEPIEENECGKTKVYTLLINYFRHTYAAVDNYDNI